MQACMIDFLLNAYLVERSKSIDISRLKIPSISSSTNALLTLETIYLNIQQSIPANANSEQLTEEINDESDETTTIVSSSENQDNSQITITVCDEAKSLKKQFPCNRTLLIREMKYFADYLKDEPDQIEEVDISVHCDLDIFQWLMSFVNRRTASKLPELEPRIAISILISSDFLKMDKLVRQSLNYIHEHLNEILATNCNVSSISENLFRQLVKKFANPLDIEQIHDRKNRIRSKLFEFSLENLLTETKIVRCQYCLNIMTCEQMERLPCLIEHLIMKPNGKLCFQHKIDPKFDINQWIKEIHAKGENSWRNTFWIIWLHIHGDECARCHEYFRFIDFSTCSYHSKLTITDGKHDCCSQMTNSFDILQSSLRPNACQQREHICQQQNLITEIYEHIDKSELIKNYPQFRTSFINPNRTNLMINKVIEQSIFGVLSNPDQKKSFVHVQWTPLLDRQPFGPDLKYVWDASKSTRWNQDTQREDEHRRYDEMLRMLLSIQQNTKSNTNRTSFITPGGIYCRIEYDWRTKPNSSMNNNTNSNKNRQRFNLK